VSRLTIITTSEKATQKSITRPRSSVDHTGFLWALCHEFVRSTTHRKPALNAAGLPFLEPFPKRLAPWEPRHQATGFRIRGAAHQIVHRPVSNREAHPFRETL